MDIGDLWRKEELHGKRHRNRAEDHTGNGQGRYRNGLALKVPEVKMQPGLEEQRGKKQDEHQLLGDVQILWSGPQ